MRVRINDIRACGIELGKDILFPARCPVCHDVIPIERRIPHYRLKMRAASRPVTSLSIKELLGSYVCPECLSDLAFIGSPYCQKCGKPLLHSHDSGVRNAWTGCADCRRKERVFRQCRCLLTYDETAQEIMADIKYHAKQEYVWLMAVLTAQRLGPWIRAIRPDAFVPVPIHPDRRVTRGYNQAELLAEALSEILAEADPADSKERQDGERPGGAGIHGKQKIPVRSDLLIRIKKTEAQKELTAEARLLNLQNAFEASEDLRGWTQPSRLLLIDDIYTTGATLNACAEELLRAGASDVYGLCIAAGEDVN
jgi:predicted amidophosphoribosyltransferase